MRWIGHGTHCTPQVQSRSGRSGPL
jgi:hypothetical protein